MTITPAAGKSPTQPAELRLGALLRHSITSTCARKHGAGRDCNWGRTRGTILSAEPSSRSMVPASRSPDSTPGTRNKSTTSPSSNRIIPSNTDGVVIDGQTMGRGEWPVLHQWHGLRGQHPCLFHPQGGHRQRVEAERRLQRDQRQQLASSSSAKSDGTNKMFSMGWPSPTCTLIITESLYPAGFDQSHRHHGYRSLSASRATNVVTLSGFGGAPPWNLSDYVLVSGCADATFNSRQQPLPITGVTGTTVTYTAVPHAADASTTGCTAVNLGDHHQIFTWRRRMAARLRAEPEPPALGHPGQRQRRRWRCVLQPQLPLLPKCRITLFGQQQTMVQRFALHYAMGLIEQIPSLSVADASHHYHHQPGQGYRWTIRVTPSSPRSRHLIPHPTADHARSRFRDRLQQLDSYGNAALAWTTARRFARYALHVDHTATGGSESSRQSPGRWRIGRHQAKGFTDW